LAKLAATLRRWLGRWRRRRRRGTIANARLRLDEGQAFGTVCRDSLQPRGSLADLSLALQRIDRHLERMRTAELGIVGRLRRSSPVLGQRVREATGQAVRARNRTNAFFIRWRAHQQADEKGDWDAVALRQEMEESLLSGRNSLSEFTDLLSPLGRDLQACLSTWEAAIGPENPEEHLSTGGR
jgi:hypothetical protein